MANSLSFLVEDLTCTVCFEIFTDPVTLKCSHSLCDRCLQEFWRTQEVLQCPVCRKQCSQDEPTTSLAFKALCQSFRTRNISIDPKDACKLHGEKLSLFCFEDQQLICVVCYTSKMHKNHKCSPVDEAAQSLKEQLKTKVEKLRTTLDDLKKAHDRVGHQDRNFAAENHIRKEFEKLRSFLNNEEEKQIQALRQSNEVQNGMDRTKRKILSRQISDLSDNLDVVWLDIAAKDITFLQNYDEMVKRLQELSAYHKPSEEEEILPISPPTMLFTTWVQMQKLLMAPLTLDPDTASVRLQVSADGYTVRYVDKKLHVPNNPERLHVGVLAKQSFGSGLHCWEVEVRNNNNWTLGVVGETVNRKLLFRMDPKYRFWCFRYAEGMYKKSDRHVKDVGANEKPSVIRLQLDFDKGELRFIDAFRNRCLCTFSGGFPEKVFPYFCTGDLRIALSIFPGNKHHT